MGYRRIDGDICVYTLDKSQILMSLHVDDFYATGKIADLDTLIKGLEK
jgi:hypothetical protein